MKISTKLITNKQTWEKFLLRRGEANFLQSWNWGKFHELLGKKIYRLGFYEENAREIKTFEKSRKTTSQIKPANKSNHLIGTCLLIKEQAKRATYLTIPGGPMVDWENRELIDHWLNDIKGLAKQESAAFIRVRPPLSNSELTRKQFSDLGFLSAPMHLHAEYTLVLDLNMSMEKILTQMRKNHRRVIKKIFGSDAGNTDWFSPSGSTHDSRRRKVGGNLTIEQSQNPQDIKEFYNHQLSLANKHHFVPFSYKYLHEQFKVFTQDNQVLLIKAFEGKQLLAEAFVIFYGPEAVYHYGISTEANRNKPGAYACQWVAIWEAKKRGCLRYNFWGLSPKNKPHHRFYGPSLFKRGFGGIEVEYLHARDLPINWWYWPNWILEVLRKKIRHLS